MPSRSRSHSRGRRVTRHEPNTPNSFLRRSVRIAAELARSPSVRNLAGKAASAAYAGYKRMRASSHSRSPASSGGSGHTGGVGSDVAGKQSFFKFNMHPTKVHPNFKFVGGTFHLQNVQPFSQACPNDQQAFNNVNYLNVDIINAVRSAIQAQNQYRAGNAVNIGVNVNQNERVFLTSYSAQIIVANASTTAMLMKIQDLKCIRDTSQDPITCMNMSSVGASSFDAVGSTTYSAGAAHTNLTPVVPGFDIRESSGVRPWWKVCKTRQFWLAPGEVFTHNVIIKFNKFVPAVLYSGEPSFEYLRGFSISTLFTFFNGPVVAAVGGQTGSGQAEIRGFTISKLKYKYGISNVNHIDQYNNMSSFGTGQQYVDEALGEVFVGGTGVGTGVVA